MIPTPEVLTQMCRADGSAQFTFGQTGVTGSTKLEASIGSGIALPEAYLPFTKAQPRSTEWSGKFMEMQYSVLMPDKAAAAVVIDALNTSFAASGWTTLEPLGHEAPLYLLGYSQGTLLERRTGEAGDGKRVLLNVDVGLGELVLTCGHDELLRTHAQEVFGKLPPGTPRPQVPEIPVPPLRSEVDCVNPEILTQVNAMMASGGANAFMSQMMARTTYRDRLSSWMLWKLDTSGKITPERLIKLSMSAIGGASPGGDPFASFKMIEEMFPLLEGLAAAENAKDMGAVCRSLIPFESWLTRVDAITLKQTQATHTALTAEAQRLGVSFE